MPLSLLSDNPLYFVIWILAILTALSLHEFFHAYAAYRLGDDTAERAGRLTLNPAAHLDWLGFFALILVGFGWGKPVPVNPHNLKYKKWGSPLVSLAGPFANFAFLAVAAVFLKILSIATPLAINNLLVQFLNLLIVINAVLLVFNLIPIPPLDGSKVLFAILDHPKYDRFKEQLESRGPLALIGLILADNLFGIGIFGAFFRFVIDAVYKIF